MLNRLIFAVCVPYCLTLIKIEVLVEDKLFKEIFLFRSFQNLKSFR